MSDETIDSDLQSDLSIVDSPTAQPVEAVTPAPPIAPPPPYAPPPAPAAASSGGVVVQHSAFDKLPTMVKQELAKLKPAQQQAFMEEFKRKAKSAPVAYLLWLIGFHYAYLGKWGMLALYWITAGGLFIWMIADAFRMPGLVNDYNRDVAVEVMGNLRMISG